MAWSSWVKLGTAAGINMNYRYNSYFVEYSYYGTLSNAGFTANSGYKFGIMPSELIPGGNMDIPVGSTGNLTLLCYPSNSTYSGWQLISKITKTYSEYISGRVIISR